MAALRVVEDGGVVADGPGWFHHELPPLGPASSSGFAALTAAALQDCIARLRSEPADSREAAHRALQAVKEPEAEALQAILRYLRATPLKGDHADRLQWCEVFQRLLAEDVEAYRTRHEPDGLPEEHTRLTHNDLCGNNLLVLEGRLVGVIDWESAMMGLTDKDCEEYGELAGTLDDADCGSGLPVAPGAYQRRRLMRTIGGVKCLTHSNASCKKTHKFASWYWYFLIGCWFSLSSARIELAAGLQGTRGVTRQSCESRWICAARSSSNSCFGKAGRSVTRLPSLPACACLCEIH